MQSSWKVLRRESPVDDSEVAADTAASFPYTIDAAIMSRLAIRSVSSFTPPRPNLRLSSPKHRGSILNHYLPAFYTTMPKAVSATKKTATKTSAARWKAPYSRPSPSESSSPEESVDDASITHSSPPPQLSTPPALPLPPKASLLGLPAE